MITWAPISQYSKRVPWPSSSLNDLKLHCNKTRIQLQFANEHSFIGTVVPQRAQNFQPQQNCPKTFFLASHGSQSSRVIWTLVKSEESEAGSDTWETCTWHKVKQIILFSTNAPDLKAKLFYHYLGVRRWRETLGDKIADPFSTQLDRRSASARRFSVPPPDHVWSGIKP
jgi:hypothetical protein